MVDQAASKRDDANDQQTELEAILNHVRTAIRDLKFGTVTLVLQDGRLVQIERTEKVRVVRAT